MTNNFSFFLSSWVIHIKLLLFLMLSFSSKRSFFYQTFIFLFHSSKNLPDSPHFYSWIWCENKTAVCFLIINSFGRSVFYLSSSVFYHSFAKTKQNKVQYYCNTHYGNHLDPFEINIRKKICFMLTVSKNLL